MIKPLKGYKIVDFTLAGAGPSCTKLLAEYGADVVWVEPLNGTSTRTVHKFDFYTTGKRSITLDLKTHQGIAVMRKLIEKADVFVSNYRTRALNRLGLGYEAVRELNPNVIYATLTGFGEEGPKADFPGYDPVAFWSYSGMLRDYAEPGSLLVPPVAVGDIATGQALAGGILAALLHRERTGESERVFTSLLAEAVYLNHDAVVEGQYGEPYPKSRKTPRRALLNTYRCRDGDWITLAALESIDVPVTQVYSTTEMINDPQVLDNHFIVPIQASDGRELFIPANPIKLGDKNSGTGELGPGPKLAGHSQEVLQELGYSEETIGELLSNNITSI